MEPDAPVTQDDASDSAGFTLALSNFEGPFDLLLQLISSKKLDVTEVALSKVTDEFIAYTRMLGETADLDETTEFLVVAATLLDLKAARLLPSGEVDSEEDLALLESRDLLFARLLQYKAYKQVAELFADWQRTAQKRYPRAASLEDRFVNLLPPVTLSHSPDSFAEMAATVFRPKPPDVVGQIISTRWLYRFPSKQENCSMCCVCLVRAHGLRLRFSPKTARYPWRWWAGFWPSWNCTKLRLSAWNRRNPWGI